MRLRLVQALVLALVTSAGHAQQAPDVPVDPRVYEAIDLAAQHVPRAVTDYYFFTVEPQLATAAMASELRDLLRATQAERGYIGITGPVPQLCLQVVRAATGQLGARELDATTVVYLGPEHQRPQIEALLRATGATVVFQPFRYRRPDGF
ncbi:MAG: hypothetical protein IT495_01870 [Gammaproteobacteria bacterium]|nr:hypothetical protein [Gammaproteobacteria bacterium]